MESFGDYSYYYNLIYGDKDYYQEAVKVKKILHTYGEDIKDLMVFGCGTGNHDRELCKLGFNCQGIDLSEQMICEAQKASAKEALNIKYEVADIRSYHPERKYDAVISLFHVVSYLNSNKDVTDAFRVARKCLNEGGCFYLTFGMDQEY